MFRDRQPTRRFPRTHYPAPCSIIPPYLLEEVAGSTHATAAERARRTLTLDQHLRGQRPGIGAGPAPLPDDKGEAKPAPRRTVSDAQNEETLPGDMVREEGSEPSGDVSVDEAYDGLGSTWTLFYDVYARNSLNDQGLPLLATVHYGQDYDNAFWNGERMVFGDGDGELFGRFTASLDVIAHELTHGVTEYTAGLAYRNQSGALNESVSDVFGILVAQHAAGLDAESSDWLIGADLILPGVQGVALRSMKEPGTAYDDPVLGKDPQPGHMDDYVETPRDSGGVHINSGIPNRAFYLAATAIGGYAWEKAGQIWYDVLTGKRIQANTDFATFAGLLVDAAAERFGSASSERAAVADAWAGVGVLAPQRHSPAVVMMPDVAQADQASPGAPASQEEVVVTRSGGVAGGIRQARVDLSGLPHEQAEQWRQALAGDRLGGRTRELESQHPAGQAGPADEARAGQPDRFAYRITYTTTRLDIELNEEELPSEVKSLVRNTMGL